MAEIRATLGVLREPRDVSPRSPAPGLSQLEELIGLAEAAEVRVELTVAGHVRTLPPAVDLTAYRIVQESLTNVLRHAGATLARVAIRYEPGGLVVQVEDDGDSSSNGGPRASDGHGLAGCESGRPRSAGG
jgi:signal transduction histidine kinase